MRNSLKTIVILGIATLAIGMSSSAAYAEKSPFTAKQQRLIKLAKEKRATLEGARIRYEIRKEGIHERNDRLRPRSKRKKKTHSR